MEERDLIKAKSFLAEGFQMEFPGGAIFTDFGVAWDRSYPKFWDENNWNNNENIGWLMSYGFGPRFMFLGIPWQLDFAWQYNPFKGTISSRSWYLSMNINPL